MKNQSGIYEGDLYNLKVGTSRKLVLVISNENDEPYSALVPPQTVLVSATSKGLFSLPFLHDGDVLLFAHSYYPTTTKLQFLREGDKIGRASKDVVELVRMTCGRRFTDDPNYFRGLTEEVIRYNKEMAELTGSKLIMVDTEIQKSGRRQRDAFRIPSIPFEKGIERFLSLPSFCRSWSDEDLLLFLDFKSMYGNEVMREALQYANKNCIVQRAANIKKELKIRGIDPTIGQPKEKEVKPEKELITPASIPVRVRPQFIYSPKTWNKKELEIFCNDLDTYTMETIVKMYHLEKPLPLKTIDWIRSCYLSTKKLPPPR